MKRMSEVFELPVKSYAFGSVYVDSLVNESVLFPDVRMCIAHAVNNVDALADALSALAWAAEGGTHAELVKALCNADSALAAYRGEE